MDWIFALSDGVYDYAIYNEKYSVYSVSYLKIISRKTIFLYYVSI